MRRFIDEIRAKPKCSRWRWVASWALSCAKPCRYGCAVGLFVSVAGRRAGASATAHLLAVENACLLGVVVVDCLNCRLFYCMLFAIFVVVVARTPQNRSYTHGGISWHFIVMSVWEVLITHVQHYRCGLRRNRRRQAVVGRPMPIGRLAVGDHYIFRFGSYWLLIALLLRSLLLLLLF